MLPRRSKNLKTAVLGEICKLPFKIDVEKEGGAARKKPMPHGHPKKIFASQKNIFAGQKNIFAKHDSIFARTLETLRPF